MKLYQDKEWLQKQIQEVKNKELIGRMCGCSGDTINYWMKKFGIPNIDYTTVVSPTRVHTCDENYFDIIDSEEKAYWLGYIMADGCVTNSSAKVMSPNEFVINCKDEDSNHLQKLNIALNSDYPVKITERYDRKRGICWTVAELRIRSVRFCKSLIKNQVVPRKTSKEVIPDTVCDELTLPFIRGFFDGDGSIFKRPLCYGVYVGKSSQQIIVQIQDFFSDNDISWNMYTSYDYSMPFYYLDTNKKATVTAILHLLYDNATVYLERKFRKAQKVLQDIGSLVE